jgi:hypothetical protein
VAGRPHPVRTYAFRAPDGAVTTKQFTRITAPVVPATHCGALALGRVYWDEVERFLGGLVRVHQRPEGPEIRLRTGGPALLRFGRAETSVGPRDVVCSFAIAGGLLARRPGGTLALAQATRERVELRSTVADFYPRLAARPRFPGWTGALYARGQARLHDAIGRRFLARLAENPIL